VIETPNVWPVGMSIAPEGDICLDCKHNKKEIFEEPCKDCFDLQVIARNFEKEKEDDE
jgi:hypothetical protein